MIVQLYLISMDFYHVFCFVLKKFISVQSTNLKMYIKCIHNYNQQCFSVLFNFWLANFPLVWKSAVKINENLVNQKLKCCFNNERSSVHISLYWRFCQIQFKKKWFYNAELICHLLSNRNIFCDLVCDLRAKKLGPIVPKYF